VVTVAAVIAAAAASVFISCTLVLPQSGSPDASRVRSHPQRRYWNHAPPMTAMRFHASVCKLQSFARGESLTQQQIPLRQALGARAWEGWRAQGEFVLS
jgi:hypothetical protein